MFKWNAEDITLLNQKGGIFIGREKIYPFGFNIERV